MIAPKSLSLVTAMLLERGYIRYVASAKQQQSLGGKRDDNFVQDVHLCAIDEWKDYVSLLKPEDTIRFVEALDTLKISNMIGNRLFRRS